MQQKLTKEKARAYVRVSTLKDSQKDSPEHQEGLIRENAASDNVEIEHVYLDRDTGTNIIEREDVRKLIEDAKKGLYKTIYFASLSRFSRDTLDALSLKRMLVNALGVRVISIEDMYDSGKEDNEMIFSIISSVNQKQSENISTSSKRGKRQSAKSGNFTGSIAPFGYKKIVTAEGRKSLEVVPEHAEVVRLIFDLYINKGMGEKLIVGFLNDPINEIMPSPKTGTWGISSVQRILQNETYTGYVTFSKLETRQVYDDINDLQNRRKVLSLRDKSKWEKTDFQTHEAIIPAEAFQEAQRIRLVRGGGARGGQRKFVNAFAKMIFCKCCGSAIVAMSGSPRPGARKYTYLVCSKRRRQGASGCVNKSWVPYEEFRDELINGVVERMNRAVNFGSFAGGITDTSEYGNSVNDFEKDIKRLEKTIADNRMLLFGIRKQHMLQEMNDNQYEFEKQQYELEIADAEQKLGSIRAKNAQRKDKDKLHKDIKAALSQITARGTYDDVEFTRITLSKLIDRIEISEEGEADVYTVLGQL
ncbi:recombinase family protein [Bacillus sp. 3255]|uniref:recombinase family protein n=1 Tax=Bacillus sp. 3255 TaxID=2817904 RepID=UPI002864BA95|nr:recombinase family protein [Bacillus sp. 3255]MDR6883043.1 DNA invertase Pin-like site-specific DNA recombinase [Bacillus sp. 3255]